jgi:hypothetical protein
VFIEAGASVLHGAGAQVLQALPRALGAFLHGPQPSPPRLGATAAATARQAAAHTWGLLAGPPGSGGGGGPRAARLAEAEAREFEEGPSLPLDLVPGEPAGGLRALRSACSRPPGIAGRGKEAGP